MLTANDLMTKDPAAIFETATVRDATRVLEMLDIRHVPVVNKAHELVGIVSDRDLRGTSIPCVVDGMIGELGIADDAPIQTLMTGDVIAVLPESSAFEVVELMLKYKIGAVPVTEPDGTLVGIVSYMDVLRVLPLEKDDAAE